MTISELQSKLLEAYSLRNLNSISLTLINLYKNRQYSILHKIAEIIGDFIDIEITADGKGFSKLILLYHPDRVNYYLNEINTLAKQNNFDALYKHAHILKLDGIEEIAHSLHSYEDIDYSPVYEWDFDSDGYSIINDQGIVNDSEIQIQSYDFYTAIKLRQYGTTDIEFPSYYLQDLEEVELSDSNIVDLDGIQFCIHTVNLDLSANSITDLTPLIGLTDLRELNLSDNKLDSIDALCRVKNLQRVHLSNNYIVDIEPLLKLEKLEYANLSGNRISSDQINNLIELGVDVDY